jgi:2'-5' RNA ligase
MRLFTAIELTSDVRQVLAAWQEALRRAIRARVSWTAPANLHLTLKFIGDVEPKQIEPIRAALRGVEAPGPIALSIDGVMRLPPRGPTRVIGAQVDGELARLHAEIEAALEPHGVAREARPFRAHVTLGRVRDRARIALDGIELSRTAELPMDVLDFVLMRSTLSDKGSTYDVIERFALMDPSRG